MIAFLSEHPWVGINVILSLVAASVATYMLIAYGDEVSVLERIGIASMASGCLLTIGPIIMRNAFDATSPFDDWSGSLLRLGCAAAFVGWMWRRDHLRWRGWWRSVFTRFGE